MRSVLGIQRKEDPCLSARVYHLVVLGEILGDEWVIAESVGMLARHQRIGLPRRFRLASLPGTPREVGWLCLALPP